MNPQKASHSVSNSPGIMLYAIADHDVIREKQRSGEIPSVVFLVSDEEKDDNSGWLL
jgi:hypothetical protein